MTTQELQQIINCGNNLSVKEIMEIIYRLKIDCFDKYNEISILNNGTSDIHSKLNRKKYFYQGEVNAFQIVLDLLNKVDIK